METPAMERHREIDVSKYVQAHASDIADLLAVVDNASLPQGEVSQGPKTFVQRLPRHMRRRAMSYNVKRLPLKHRVAAKSAISKSKHRKKPPSRKYRDFTNHAVVQDISHQACFQLDGPRNKILEFLERFTPCQLGLTFAAKSAANVGTSGPQGPLFTDTQTHTPGVPLSYPREGHTVVYRPGLYPRGVIGPVRFIWRTDRIWIFTHGAMTEEFFSVLTNELKNGPENVKLEVFRRGFSRFRISGPQALNVLKISLKPVLSEDLSKIDSTERWWSEILGKSDIGFLNLGNVDESFVGIFPFIVRNPRLFMKHAKRADRTEMGNPNGKNSRGTVQSKKVFASFRNSPLWSEVTRQKCLEEKKSQKEINDEQTRTLFDDPISAAKPQELKSDENLVPIWAIFDVARSGFDSGSNLSIDLLIPRGWGLDIWLALQYGTARAIGSENVRNLSSETGFLDGFQGFPDSQTGRRIFREEWELLEEKWTKKPRNRRPDWRKLGIEFPFSLPFMDSKNSRNFVLRDKIYLLKMAQNLLGKEDFEFLRKADFDDAIVPIRVICHGKGVPGRNGILFRKNQEPDISGLSKTRTEKNLDEEFKSENEVEDDLLSQLLFDGKDRKRNRKRKKSRKINYDFQENGDSKNPNGKLPEEERKSNAAEIFGNSPASKNPVLGYLVHGGFSFRLGKGVGLGFAYLPDLLNLLENGEKDVLLRNITSKCYRVVELKVIC